MILSSKQMMCLSADPVIHIVINHLKYICKQLVRCKFFIEMHRITCKHIEAVLEWRTAPYKSDQQQIKTYSIILPKRLSKQVPQLLTRYSCCKSLKVWFHDTLSEFLPTNVCRTNQNYWSFPVGLRVISRHFLICQDFFSVCMGAESNTKLIVITNFKQQ